MSGQHAGCGLILTIDDEEMMSLMLHKILQPEGFEIIKADNGREGIGIIKARRPDLVLLDLMMPEMDGFDCLQAIRAIPNMQMLPIVMLTSVDDIDSINRSFQLGATDFIAKPINWPTLPHRLRYLLRAAGALTQLAKSEAELRTAQKIARLGSWEWSVADDRLQCSAEVFNLLNLDTRNFKGHYSDLYTTLASADADKLGQLTESCLKNKHNLNLQLAVRQSGEADRVILICGEPILIDNTVVRIQGTIQDITERQRIEEQIRFLSYYDSLTGLPNRVMFKDVLGHAIAYCKRYNSELATLFVSIDRFKRINEALGPSTGDEILKAFAERLVNLLRDCDYVATNAEYSARETTVSRLGGNAFTLLLNNIQDSRDCVKIAKRIFQTMAEPFHIAEREIFLSISIGIATYPGDGNDADSFIKNGEFAMSHAREQGQNTYQFYSKSLNIAAFHKLSMENNLRRAIERDELRLYFQAKVNMRQPRIIGCEALIRWQHPELGLVPPAQFIPIAEDSGLITDISNWVLAQACKQICRWRELGLPSLVMAVNVSASQFHQRGFVTQVSNLLTSLSLDPQYLKLELTESILLEGIEEALITLRQLRHLGVQISIDDFGTGYSSLAYLKKLPISELKIDRSFIHDIPHNEEDMAITIAILALAKSLSLEVVAEGVEHEDQVKFLLEHGCEIAQGFLYDKPLDADEFEVFLMHFGDEQTPVQSSL